MNLYEMLIDLFIDMGLIKRTKPIQTDNLLAGILKFQKKYDHAVSENNALAARIKEEDEKAAETHDKELKRMLDEYEKRVQTKEDARIAVADKAKETAGNAIEEAKIASIISGNIKTITTRQIATAKEEE